MQILPITMTDNAKGQVPKNVPSFKTKLSLTFPTSDIKCNYNKGECNFENVITKFREWLSNQYPKTSTLTISKKTGKYVPQSKVHGAGGVHTEMRPENLEFSMDGAKCGFCWNEQSDEISALEDFKRTFNYVKEKAGW